MKDIYKNLIKLRDDLNANIKNLNLENINKSVNYIVDEKTALLKINTIVDIINLCYYNDSDCLREIIKILSK